MDLKHLSEKLTVRKVEVNGKALTLQKVKNLPLAYDDWLDDYRTGYSDVVAKISSHIVYEQICKRAGKVSPTEQPHEFDYGIIIHKDEALFLAIVFKHIEDNFSFSADWEELSNEAKQNRKALYGVRFEPLTDEERFGLKTKEAEITQRLQGLQVDLVDSINEIDLTRYIDL